MNSSTPDQDIPSDKALFDFLLENTTDQIYFKDRKGRFLRISRAVAEYMNVADPQELIGKSDFDFWSKKTAQAAAADEQHVMESGEALVGKIEELVYPNGRVAWDYTSKLPLRDASGEIIGIFGINKDFTKVKEMEDALREERNRLRIITAELEARNKQIEADLQMARKVQEALLPDEQEISVLRGDSGLVFAHHYRPAAAVGGDFFHMVPLSGDRVGVLICDVMGHGVRAALITGIIRGLIDELRPQMLDPGRFLCALNRRVRSVLERIDVPFIATAFYFVADPAKSELCFSSAGHPKPVRLHKGVGLIGPLGDEHMRGGPALGLLDEAVFPSQQGPLEKDDRIVLFTDGIYEMEDSEGNEFGLEALHKAFGRHSDLPAVELFSAVLEDVREFSGKSDFIDDVCMISVRRA